MSGGALIPAEVLKRTDLPIYVKLIYGRVAVIIAPYGSTVLTAKELANQCGLTQRQVAKSLRFLVSLGLIRFHRSLDDRNTIHVFQKVN